jgi:hypothetical protein
VEGMMMPHMMEQKIGTQTAMVLKVEKVELNPKLDKAIFSLPVEGGSKN